MPTVSQIVSQEFREAWEALSEIPVKSETALKLIESSKKIQEAQITYVEYRNKLLEDHCEVDEKKQKKTHMVDGRLEFIMKDRAQFLKAIEEKLAEKITLPKLTLKELGSPKLPVKTLAPLLDVVIQNPKK